jgi:hypothetical protein
MLRDTYFDPALARQLQNMLDSRAPLHVHVRIDHGKVEARACGRQLFRLGRWGA